MDYEVEYTPLAKSDLEEIWLYLAYVKGVPVTARRLVHRLEAAIEKLSYLGRAYKLCPLTYLAAEGVRTFSLKNYTVYYVVDESSKCVEVLRVLNGRRDVTRLKKADFFGGLVFKLWPRYGKID